MGSTESTDQFGAIQRENFPECLGSCKKKNKQPYLTRNISHSMRIRPVAMCLTAQNKMRVKLPSLLEKVTDYIPALGP